MCLNQWKGIYFILLFYMITHFYTHATEHNQTSSPENDIIINTASGPIEGVVVKTFTRKDVTAFYGIPYAEPPVGKLRFKPPVPIKQWTKLLKASTKPLPCYQQRLLGDNEVPLKRPWSEDCLKLNIWTPRPGIISREQKLAVMIVIHSGLFLSGSGLHQTDGATFALEGELYVVTMNYRLGAFGFLYYGHPEAPGNVGLMDQQLAMKWVHKNIPYFGKDTGGIILLGGGTGSASVNYQMLSRSNAGLFRTVVHRSGVSIDPMSFANVLESKRTAESLAESLDCKRESIFEEIECLRKAHPEDIIDASTKDLSSVFTPNQFKPTVDGQFITQPPHEALEQGNYNNVTVMCSTQAQDGSVLLSKLNPDMKSRFHEGISREMFRTAVKRLLPDLTENDLNLVEDLYLDSCSLNDHNKVLSAAVMVYTDVVYACPINQFLDIFSKRSLHSYRTVHTMKHSKNPKWMGAIHGTEMLLYFGYPLLGESAGYTEEEAEISRTVIDLTKKFTRLRVEDVWKMTIPYTRDVREYNTVSVLQPHVPGKDYRGRECHFWQKTLPQLKATRNSCRKFN